MRKRILKITGVILVALIALVFLIPVLFKTHITNLVKKEINNNVNARVDFKDVSLSFFRHFPRISITVEDLSVIGVNNYENDTLISVPNVDATVNIISVIKGNNIKVSGVYLESPRIHLVINKQGESNWDIAKKADMTAITDTTLSAFKMTLKNYEISNAYINYDDEITGVHAQLSGVDHKGSGDFTKDVFTLKTRTETNAASFMYANIPYLVNTKTGIDADINIDNSNNKYTFKTDDILLNNLKLSLDGFFQILDDSTYFMDIRFNSPTNNFKDILSMLPVIYKKDFDKLNASGQAQFNGFMKGIYSPQQMPAYDVTLEVKDGSFHYPDLPKKVRNIQMSVHVSNPDGQLDNTIINISQAHLQIDNEPLDFRLLYKQPQTVKYLDAAVKGRIDLSQISKFLKLEKGTKLRGKVFADAFMKGNLSALNSQVPFTAGGSFDIKDLFYSSKDLPHSINKGSMRIQVENIGGNAHNTTININPAHIELGKDRFDFSLWVTNPFSTFDFNGKMKGKLTLENLEQFMNFEKGTKLSGIVRGTLDFAGNKTAIDKGEYDRISLNGNAQLSNIKYRSNDYPSGIIITTSSLDLNDRNVTLNNATGSYLNSNFKASGDLSDLTVYMMNKGILKGNINLSADKMNLNDWTEKDVVAENSTGTIVSPFIVPADLDITLNAKARHIEYDKVHYKNVSGAVILKDETITLQSIKAEALEGSMLVNGHYSTKRSQKEPDISMNYDIKGIDVQKAFRSYNTVKALLPIGQFLDGKLSSQLAIQGNLDGNMMPALNSLTGKGNLLLVEGVLKKFAPLEKIAVALQIDELKDITIKDVKNYIEFANGKVLVKPFTVKVKDIELLIGGTHSFDHSMNYIVGMKVPRSYLGTQGNRLVDGLVTTALANGISIKPGEIVNLLIKVGGSVMNPTIDTDLEEMAGDAVADLRRQAAYFAIEKVETVKQTLKDTVKTVKKQAVTEVKKAVKDELKKTLVKDVTTRSDIAASTKTPADKLKSSLEELRLKRKKVRAIQKTNK